MPSRKQRRDLILRSISGSWFYEPLYPALFECAITELRLALYSRGKGLQGRTNHLTPHATGSIVLFIDGLEAWLNDVIFKEVRRKEGHQRVFDMNVKRKYSELSSILGGTELSVPDRLALVIDIRNEIVHHWPLLGLDAEADTPNVPEWFRGLERQGDFLNAKDIDANLPIDIDFGRKLQSYGLAYWAWESVDEAVTRLTDSWRPQSVAKLHYEDSTQTLFKQYKLVCRPEQLPKFDKEFD